MLKFRALLILAGWCTSINCLAVEAASDQLSQAKDSIVRLVVKFPADPLELKKTFKCLQVSDSKPVIEQFEKIISAAGNDDKSISLGSGVVVSKDGNSAFIATSIPIENLSCKIFVRGAGNAGNDEVEFFGGDEDKGLYFLKYKVVRESLKPYPYTQLEAIFSAEKRCLYSMG